MNTGMALLARHLKRYAQRPHYAEIGTLFRMWGRSPLELEWGDVWRRIFHLTKKNHEKDFSRLARVHEQFAQAESELFNSSGSSSPWPA